MRLPGAFLAPLSVLGLLPALPADAGPVKNPKAVVEEMIRDMTLPHEGRPHGVPDAYDWARRPRLSMGNAPGRFRAFSAWGQLYEDAGGNPARNTRVHLRTLQAWILSRKDGTWRRVQEGRELQGAAFREDFVENRNRPADARPVKEGGVSASAGDGHNYHFWPAEGRVPIDPDDVAGVVIAIQARLVLDDPLGPDDRAKAKYLLGVGADYWLDVQAAWDHFKTNADVGIGRFRYVTEDWAAFTMTTAPADVLRKNPPPIE